MGRKRGLKMAADLMDAVVARAKDGLQEAVHIAPDFGRRMQELESYNPGIWREFLFIYSLGFTDGCLSGSSDRGDVCKVDSMLDKLFSQIRDDTDSDDDDDDELDDDDLDDILIKKETD
jgi:hypothetical protein